MSDKKLHIVLIGNYRKDHQRSMILFLQMLKDGYTANGHNVDVWLPTTFFGVLSGNTLGHRQVAGIFRQIYFVPFGIEMALHQASICTITFSYMRPFECGLCALFAIQQNIGYMP